MNRRPYLPLRDLKETFTRYVEFQPKKLIVRSSRSSQGTKGRISPHVLAILGVVCGADTDSPDTKDEDSAKSGMS